MIRYQSNSEEGFASENSHFVGLNAFRDPKLVLADSTHSIFTADMTSDGLVDLVRIVKGKILY
jgi:hypothetical protein